VQRGRIKSRTFLQRSPLQVVKRDEVSCVTYKICSDTDGPEAIERPANNACPLLNNEINLEPTSITTFLPPMDLTVVKLSVYNLSISQRWCT